MTNKSKIFFAAFVLAAALAMSSLAATATTPVKFEMVPAESHINFQAKQGGSTIKGEFKRFTAQINFHPEALAASSAKVVIDMASYAVDDKDASGALQDKEWFSTSLFPQAVFEATSFTALGNNKYEALGTLTIKGHTENTKLSFTLNNFSNTAASVTGEALLKRKAFGIGEESTDSIADDVRVTISLNAVGKK